MTLETAEPRCHVGFSIFGTGLNLEGISHALGIPPSRSYVAGDLDLSARPYLRDRWGLHSPLPKTEPVDNHLNWLRQALQPHYEYLRSLADKAELRVYIGFTFRCEQNGFSVSPENLRFFTELNVSLEVTILCGPGPGQS
jgi:hypothetical protein